MFDGKYSNESNKKQSQIRKNKLNWKTKFEEEIQTSGETTEPIEKIEPKIN